MINVKKFVCKNKFSCNTYICNNEKSAFIVDLGYFDLEIENYLKKLNLPIKFILLTHGHFDHIGGVNKFLMKYPSTKVYLSSKEVDIVLSSRKNCSLSFNPSDPYVLDCDFNLIGEGNFQIDGFNFEVIETPGHTLGSVMYYFNEEKIIFTGDTIIGGSIGRSDLPTGSEVDLFDSLLKFKKLHLSDDTKIYSGHGEDYYYSLLIKINNYLK